MKATTHLTSLLLLLLLPLLAVLTDAITPPTGGCPATSKSETVFTKLPLDGVLFTQDVLFETQAQSGIECARSCGGRKDCRMLTFQPPQGEASGTCRAHSKLLSLSHSRTNAVGASSFRLEDGYSWQCGRQLRVTMMLKSFPQAVDLCCQLGQGDLVMPKTVADRDCIYDLRTSLGFPHMWIGASDLETEGRFKWLDGSLLSSSDPVWQQGQPWDAGNADCAALLSQRGMHDIECHLSHLVMCQKL